MLITTTSVIEGAKITRYYGIVSGETIIGANVFRDFFAVSLASRSTSSYEPLRPPTTSRILAKKSRNTLAPIIVSPDTMP